MLAPVSYVADCATISTPFADVSPGPAPYTSRTVMAHCMQVVSKDYIDVTRNFIRLMERNSALTRHHLFLMCMDDESLVFFEGAMGIRCVPMSAFDLPTHQDIWKLR